MARTTPGAAPPTGQTEQDPSRTSGTHKAEDGGARRASPGTTEQTAQDRRSAPPTLWKLLLGIGEDLKTLAAQQVRMAIHEVQLEIARVKLIAGFAIGLLLLAQALLVGALLGLIAVLHTYAGLSLLVSSLLVFGILLVAGAGLALFLTQQLRRLRFYPARTWHTLKEDIRWIVEQLNSRKT